MSDFVKIAAENHSDLNIFSAVIALMENGLVYTRDSQRTADRIVKICQAELQRKLRKYDDAALRAHAAREK